MKILDVRRIGFHRGGDTRSPEDFSFPAAMTSLTECLTGRVSDEVIYAHGRSYIRRTDNMAFVTASGTGFALLWSPDMCMSALDLLQAAPYEKGIAGAFAWAGWEYDTVCGADMRARAVASIDAGRPLIAFGLTEVPEAALVCGYDDGGATLIGWSHFGDELDKLENGMFVCHGWDAHTWELEIPTRPAESRLSVRDIVSAGVEIMERTSAQGYLAGDAAHAAWRAALEACEGEDGALFEYHHNVLFNMAEARCWCSDWLVSQGVEAARHFHNIHDLCWKADAAARTPAALADPKSRAELLRVMDEIRAEDAAALKALRLYLRGRSAYAE